MNLQEIRDFCRAQLDVDEEEYPNALLDVYITEGFNRTMALEIDWPGYEQTWPLTKADGESTIAIPADANPAGIYSLYDDERGVRLTQVSVELAEDSLARAYLLPYMAFYTIWGDTITLWPQNGGPERTYVLRGQRKPSPPTGTASEPLDCDERLHLVIAHYAIALMYANQEDEVMEQVYMKRWQEGFAAIRHSIKAPRHHRPLVLNGGLGSIIDHGPLPIWNVP